MVDDGVMSGSLVFVVQYFEVTVNVEPVSPVVGVITEQPAQHTIMTANMIVTNLLIPPPPIFRFAWYCRLHPL
jgi:hypothetical protein